MPSGAHQIGRVDHDNLGRGACSGLALYDAQDHAPLPDLEVGDVKPQIGPFAGGSVSNMGVTPPLPGSLPRFGAN